MSTQRFAVTDSPFEWGEAAGSELKEENGRAVTEIENTKCGKGNSESTPHAAAPDAERLGGALC